LVLTPNSMYEVKGEENSVVAEDLPERFSLPDGVEQNDIAVFYSMHGKWTLTPRNLAAANGFVRQLDTIIWDANSEELCGVTIAEVSIRNLNQFAIRLPPGLRVTYIDSGDVVTSPVKDNLVGELVVPVAPRAVDRDMSFLLKVWWTLPKTSIAMRYDIPLLQPKELPIISQQIVFLGSDESRYEVTGSPLFLRVDPVNLLNSQAPKKSSPTIRLLEDAGYFPSSDQATSILIGTVEYDSSQRADALISIWRLSKQLRRFLLILLVSILGLIIGWKTRGYFLLRDQLSRINHSLYAGPTLLALLIWTSGPILMGITLTLLSVTAWGLALWKAHGHATEFEYTPVTTS
ncbi:MAG: hypothetical protein KDA52_24560, partial [Planctomycetaceae bacterium]|nr:hypothetical protein [Planctomycetaceae bacterium]